MTALKETYKGYNIEIVQDETCQSPREMCDCLSKITYRKDARDILGDTPVTQDELDEIIKDKENFCVPIFAYVHSGQSISRNRNYPYNCPWDSGCSGAMFVKKSDAEKEFSLKWGQELEEKILKMFDAEIEELNNWWAGNCWGYVITKPVTCETCKHTEQEDVESCWGFIGDASEVMTEAKNVVDGLTTKE